jgi:DNA-binding response OmpR family regulator
MSTERPRILIIDDELACREMFEHFLQGEGYVTESADNGKHALTLIAERLPDLIVLDIAMPGMDGYEVAHLLKSHSATAVVPIIIITGQTGHASKVVGLSTGVECYLTKPISPSELGLNVRNLLRLRGIAIDQHTRRGFSDAN